MVCIARFRNFIARSPPIQHHLKLSPRDLALDHESRPPRPTFFPHSCRSFREIAATMLDLGAATTGTGPGPAVGGMTPRGYVTLTGGWRSKDGRLSCGYSSFRGTRPSMEDFYDVKTSKIDGETVNLFGVFDGHGGSRAAVYLKEHLFDNLMKHSQFMTDTKAAICETYKKTDSDFLNVESKSLRDDGSTASTAVLIGRRLYVANVGDSRVVMSKAGKAVALSNDHKPNRTDERQRIENAGGVIAWAGTWRVGGVLAMSRAFGNRLLKRYVVAEPEIQEQDVDNDLEFLVLASDGLWDVVPNAITLSKRRNVCYKGRTSAATNLRDVVSIASREEQPEAAALKLMETAFARGSADNITCIVVRFHHDMMEIDSP